MGVTARFVRVPSERDRIVGLLLALDAAVRLLSSEENEKQIERLALLVRELEWACSGLTDGEGDPYEELAPIAYGVPEWLRGDDSGLAAVVESLRERPAANGNGAVPAGAERPHDVWRAVACEIWPQEEPSAANRQRDLDTLEWLKMTLDEQRQGPTLRSAGFDLTDVAQASSAAAEQLDAELDPRSVDVAWRLLRVDVPVVVRRDLTRSGVLVGLECWFAPPPADGSDPVHPGAEPGGPAEAPGELCMTPSFIAGVRDGHAAALDLLERLGAGEQRRRVASLRFRAVGVMPPFVLDERSAGLPTALHVIGTALGLPVPGVVTSGPIARDGGSVLEPMDADDVRAKLDAVRSDGFRDALLAHVADPQLDAPGLRVLGSPRLEDACLAVWGEDWLARRREIVGARLRERGFAVAWSPREIEVPLERHRNQEVLVFPLPEAERLAELLDENHPFGTVVQAEAASGKTMFARQVCQLLHERSEQTWLTVRVTVDPALLRDDDHATVTALARRALEGEPAPRKLLVVDDLRAHADFKELAAFVNALRNGLQDVSVLALSELYKETERWNTDGVHVGSFNERRSESFDQPLFAAFPALDVGTDRIRLAERVSGQANIGMFIKCLSHLAENPALTDDAAMWDWVLGGFDDDLNETQRERIAYLAALSSRRLATSPEMLRDVPERILARLGARRRDDGWVIPSGPVQAAILIRDVPGQVPWRYDGWRLKGLSADAMAKVLDKLPADEAAEAAVGLMMASRLGDRWLERVLVSRLDGVMRLLRKRSDTTAVLAVLLKKHHRLLESAERKEWTLELARRMTRSMRALSVPELADGIEALWLNQRHLEDDSVIDELTSVLDRDLATVLLNDRHTGVQGRVRLMRQMFRFRVTNNGEILHRNARHFLKGANPRRPGHFRAIREATRYVDLGEREPVAADGEAGVRFDLADGVTVRTLVPSQAVIAPLGEMEPMLREPDEEATAGVFLGWLELRLAFEERGTDWDGIVAPIIEPLCASIARTSLDELTEAVEHLARHHRDFCLRLLGMRALVTPFVKRLERAEPSKAAQFINLLNRLRPGTAFEVLYDGDRPRRKLADRFVERLARLGDAKAAGQLIKATWRVDELYGTVEKGFARHIGDGLGVDFVTDRLTRDPRTSVLFHLVEALTWARVDFLEDAADPAIDHIAETIRQDGRPQAPRLARHLASDDVLGSRGTADDFIAKLRGALDLDNGVDLLVRRMTGADDPDEIAAFNELAAALDGAGSELAEAFADRFSAEWLREAAPARARGSAASMARACRAARETVLRAGRDDPRPEIEKAFGNWYWERAIDAERGADELLQALREVSRFSRAAARGAARTLGPTLADAIGDSIDKPARGVELMREVERLHPGAGRALLSDLKRRKRAWRSFYGELRHVGDPVAWSEGMLGLAELGHGFSTADVEGAVRRWGNAMWTIRSPHALAALLAAFAAIADTDFATEMAGRINVQALSRRLGQGALLDLHHTAALVGALWAVDQRDTAQSALGNLRYHSQHVADVLPPSMLAPLLRTLHVVDPGFAGEVAAKAEHKLTQWTARRYVFAPRRHWSNVGWVAREISLVRGAAAAVAEVPKSLLAERPDVVLWVAAWLEERPWVVEARAAALAAVAGEEDADARTLLALSVLRAGALPSLRGSGRGLPPELLWALADAAQDDATLKDRVFGGADDAGGAIASLQAPWRRTELSGLKAVEALRALQG